MDDDSFLGAGGDSRSSARLPRTGETLRYVVVGVGVVGAISAYRLAQTGAEVTLIEGRDIGGGASA